MAQIGTLETFGNPTNTDFVDALPLQSNYSEILSKYNDHDSAITDVHGITSPAYMLSSETAIALIYKHIPIGGIKYIWDNDQTEIRSLLDSDRFHELDGSICTDSDSLYYGYTLPDMAQSFVVGVGTTDGSGDIASTDIPLTKVGNVLSDFDHDHTTITHDHVLSSHTHSMPHSHVFDTYIAMGSYSPTNTLYYKYITSQSTTTNEQFWEAGFPTTHVGNLSYGITCGNSSSSTTVTTGSNTGTLSGTSITSQEYGSDLEMRPLSCRVKAYLRIK